MKEKERLKERRAISPVISALVLSTVVLTIGGVLWSFSQGAMTISAEDYAESVINMTDTISERFIIEHVSYDGTNLYIWVYNYGDVDIEIEVTYPENFIGWTEVSSKDLEKIDIGIVLSPNTEVGIKVESRRGNDVYYRYVVPS